jgi:CRISPR-associated protein Csb2
MFAIRVTYLMGRVYSAVFDDGDSKVEAEWPPHPSRLFSALVSAWGDGGAEEELKVALEWIESQDAPTIHAGDSTLRKLVHAFVPVNDPLREQYHRSDRKISLPEDRARKPRAFPSSTLAQPDVYFVWKDSPPSNIASALGTLLDRTSSLGHSASLVAAEITEIIPEPAGSIWQPDPAGETRMRIAYPGRLKELTARYERFQRNPSKIHRPSAGDTTLYGRPPKAQSAGIQGTFDRMIVLKRDSGSRASLRSALSITAALRGAIMANAPQPIPEYISGHAPESTKDLPVRTERPHIALVPLPFVAAEHATGELMGMGALLPKTLTREEQDICWRILAAVNELKMQWGKWEVSVTDAEEHRRALRPETWTRPSAVWSTVTPFVFDRFPKDPFGSEAEQVARQAFVRSGFPEPVEVDLHYNAWHSGVPKASAFPAALARPGKPQRYHCHVRARFSGLVRGPMVAGAGRYYGYGLFRALPGRTEAQ